MRGNFGRSNLFLKHRLPFQNPLSAGFLPSNIAGLQLWLDFSDITTLFTDAAGEIQVTADDDEILVAEDKSGNGNHATESATGQNPLYKVNIINGLSIGRFDGSDDALEMPLTLENAKTVFISGKINTVPDTDEFDSIISIKFSNTNFSDFFFSNLGGAYQEITFMHDYDVGVNGVGIGLTLDTDPHVWSHTYDNNDPELVGSYTGRIENTSQTIAASGALGRTATDVGSIGGRVNSVGVVSGSADFDMLEILVYDSVLSGGNQQSVRTYMIDRAGL